MRCGDPESPSIATLPRRAAQQVRRRRDGSVQALTNMVSAMWTRAVAAAACAVLISACSSSDEADIVPAQDAELVAAGEAIYQATCSSCHGSDLRGTDRGPSHLSAVYRPNHHSDAAFLLAVKVGVAEHHWRFGAMDPIPGLTDEDVAAVTAFVRDRQRTEGFEPYPP